MKSRKSSDDGARAGSSRQSTSGRSKSSRAPKDPARTKNPLTHIRFGSAGSGGAEFEPPRKPKR